MIRQSLIKLLQDFAATPSDTDSALIKGYIDKHAQELLALSPARASDMAKLLAMVRYALDSDFDAIKLYRIIDKLRSF